MSTPNSPSAAEGGEGVARNARRVGCLSKGSLASTQQFANSSGQRLDMPRRRDPARPPLRASTLPALRAVEGGLPALLLLGFDGAERRLPFRGRLVRQI